MVRNQEDFSSDARDAEKCGFRMTGDPADTRNWFALSRELWLKEQRRGTRNISIRRM